MKPTIEDLQRLLPEAREEYRNAPTLLEEPGPLAADAVDALRTLLLMLAAPTVVWADVRALFQRALYLVALGAWRAGERLPVWHLNVGGKLAPVEGPAASAREAILDYLRRFVGTGGGVVWGRILGEVKMPGDALRAAMRELVAEGLVTQSDDPITLYAPTSKAWPEKPAAKGADVEALLKEAAHHSAATSAPWTSADIIKRLAAACRSAMERADTWQRAGEANDAYAHEATRLLAAVLDWGWPEGTMGPEVVRKARAFLAGEGLVAGRDEVAQAHDVLSRAGVCAGSLVERIKILVSSRDVARHEEDSLEAQLRAEDEAHAHTRARLAEVERHTDENVQARQKAQFRAAGLELRLAESQRSQRDALAAQNRAESEAAELRIRVTDLQRVVAEAETALDAVVSNLKKGEAR